VLTMAESVRLAMRKGNWQEREEGERKILSNCWPVRGRILPPHQPD
jgi:hypothetical protein